MKSYLIKNDDGTHKSFIDIIFLDQEGNKYFCTLSVMNMFECEASHLCFDIQKRGNEIMLKRLAANS